MAGALAGKSPPPSELPPQEPEMKDEDRKGLEGRCLPSSPHRVVKTLSGDCHSAKQLLV